ncbi:hypothetical protein [Hymenobacter sp. 102]
MAQKHQVGFYDPSFEGLIFLPDNGELMPMEEAEKQKPDQNKPWWKLW